MLQQLAKLIPGKGSVCLTLSSAGPDLHLVVMIRDESGTGRKDLLPLCLSATAEALEAGWLSAIVSYQASLESVQQSVQQQAARAVAIPKTAPAKVANAANAAKAPRAEATKPTPADDGRQYSLLQEDGDE